MNDLLSSRALPWILLSGFFVYVLYLLAPVLTPFFVAALLAYLMDPVADWLETKKLSRTMSVVVIFAVLTLMLVLALLVMVPMLEGQIRTLAQRVPEYTQTIVQDWLPQASAFLGIDAETLDVQGLKQMLTGHWQEAGGFAKQILGSVSKSGLALLALVGNAVLIPVVGFYLLRDWDVLMGHVRDMLPRRIEGIVSIVAKESDEMLGAFLRGQLTVMAALSAIYSVGLWMVGLELSLVIGLLAGVVSFVPYLGLVVGIAAAGVAVIMQTGDPMMLIWVALVFGVAQTLEGVVLTPLLVGDQIGLHPVTVIFAVLAGGQLFGFLGVLLALPVAAILAVVFRHLHRGYKDSLFYHHSDASDG